MLKKLTIKQGPCTFTGERCVLKDCGSNEIRVRFQYPKITNLSDVFVLVNTIVDVKIEYTDNSVLERKLILSGINMNNEGDTFQLLFSLCESESDLSGYVDPQIPADTFIIQSFDWFPHVFSWGAENPRYSLCDGFFDYMGLTFLLEIVSGDEYHTYLVLDDGSTAPYEMLENEIQAFDSRACEIYEYWTSDPGAY